MISQVPDVDVDPNGVFKYILIKLTITNDDGLTEEKHLVRGYASCSYHHDIKNKVTEELQKLKSTKHVRDWCINILGGGKINHDSTSKKLKVYGSSNGYGKADHQISVDVLKKKFSDYSISWEDEWYYKCIFNLFNI